MQGTYHLGRTSMAISRTRVNRAHILEGAWSILDGGPMAELTVDAIARSLQMSKSTLYKYFTSKDEVVVGLVEDACAHVREEIRDVSRDLPSMPLGVAVREVLDLYARFAERLPSAVLHDARSLPSGAAAQLDAAWAELHALCRTAVARGGKPDEVVAKALSSSARAAMVVAVTGEVQASRGDAVRGLSSLFLRGMS